MVHRRHRYPEKTVDFLPAECYDEYILMNIKVEAHVTSVSCRMFREQRIAEERGICRRDI